MIQYNDNDYASGGKEKLVLSTVTRIGGKNSFLGLACITIGWICAYSLQQIS